MAKSRLWIREELLLAMNLYCRTPFGRMHKGNRDIIALAEAIDRTPSSVAMKLVNLASLDPAERARGVSGLTKASRADRAIWDEFHSDWEALAVESEAQFSATVGPRMEPVGVEESSTLQDEVTESTRANTEQLRETKTRVGQGFFRRCVLTSYDGRCCVSGIALQELLIASHIVPWKDSPQHRVNPRNGLCLSRLHDGAFDRGLVTFDNEFRLVLSRRLHEHITNATLRASFEVYEGEPLTLPERFRPDDELLAKHRETVFQN